MATVISGLPPVALANAQVLILGTLPSQKSLSMREYYAQSRNRFWWLMGQIVGASRDLPYLQRLDTLKMAGAGLWDVCASAQRAGSSDSNIIMDSVVPNDFIGFFQQHPHIKRICFNGNLAEKIYKRRVLNSLPPPFREIQRVVLPSTSAVHAKLSPEEKLLEWRAAIEEFICQH